MAASPVHLLERMAAQSVALTLKDHRVVTGRLLGCDEHLNLVLDDAEERIEDVRRRLGRVVLRGSSVVTVHIPGGSADRRA